MGTTADKLALLVANKQAIRDAITEKTGEDAGEVMSTYAEKIMNMQASSGDSSSGGAGSVFKITNKLNGQLIGGPGYGESFTHSYDFSGDLSNAFIFIDHRGFPNTDDLPPTFQDYEVTLNMSSALPYSSYMVSLDNQGFISFEPIYTAGGQDSSVIDTIMYIAADASLNYDVDFFQYQCSTACLLKDTPITMSGGASKLIQDIDYNDELKVWDFDNGEYSSAKPLWIKKAQTNTYYYHCVFDNGITLDLVGDNGKCHRLFNHTDGLFESATDCVGKQVWTEQGVSTLLSCERIDEDCEYYNIITEYHINMFAAGVLTSCRYNNIYPIVDMKFVKDGRLARQPRWKVYAEKFRPHPAITAKYINGLRLYEQEDIPIEDTVAYINRLEALRKRIDDFEGNFNMVTAIEESNVGWITPDGNVYGYRLYMPGQMNHITLADTIGKALNLEEEPLGGYSRTLEKLGWVKYTNVFLLSSGDKPLTDIQHKKLIEFITVNDEVQRRGTIKLGTILSPDNSIEYIKVMPIDDFENKLKGR